MDIDGMAVSNNTAASRFEARIGDQAAILDYRRTPQEIVFTHTKTPKALEGRGIGSKLVRTGLEFAREEHLRVVPQCPFVAWYIREHPEYAELVHPDVRARITKRK